MNIKKRELANKYKEKCISFSNIHNLPGIEDQENLESLSLQMMEASRRIEYVRRLIGRNISTAITDPSTDSFNPIMAAALLKQQGQLDEAIWLVFLLTHFGRNLKSHWSLLAATYGGAHDDDVWTWDRVKENPRLFSAWIVNQADVLRLQGGFGNHRKYESLDSQNAGTGKVIESYVQWISNNGSHLRFFHNTRMQSKTELFQHLYESMDVVCRFGRTAKFDYLTMLGKLELAAIEPGSAYLHGATGPLAGAKLLIGGSKNARVSIQELDSILINFGNHLNEPFSMQLLEDSICNWQKSPGRFIAFRG